MIWSNQYYVPKTKAELLKMILPHWTGKKGELRAMDRKQLKGIFHSIRQKTLIDLMSKKD